MPQNMAATVSRLTSFLSGSLTVVYARSELLSVLRFNGCIGGPPGLLNKGQ